MNAKIDARLGELIEERQAVSGAISERVRAVSFGVLAIVWLLLGGTEAMLSGKFESFSMALLWIAALGVVALLLDFVQSVAALIEINNEARAAEKANKLSEVGYNSPTLRFISTSAMVLKIVTALAAAFCLLIVMYRALTA